MRAWRNVSTGPSGMIADCDACDRHVEDPQVTSRIPMNISRMDSMTFGSGLVETNTLTEERPVTVRLRADDVRALLGGAPTEAVVARVRQVLAGLADPHGLKRHAADQVRAGERERIARYLDRVADRLRTSGLLGDEVRAGAWGEAAAWCRDETIWGETK